jgi:hypothetical protein
MQPVGLSNRFPIVFLVIGKSKHGIDPSSNALLIVGFSTCLFNIAVSKFCHQQAKPGFHWINALPPQPSPLALTGCSAKGAGVGKWGNWGLTGFISIRQSGVRNDTNPK